MSAKVYTVTQLNDEIERVASGGAIDRAAYIKWLQLASTQLEDFYDALCGEQEERAGYAKHAADAAELLASLAMVLDIARMAARGQIAATKPIEWARDTAPFKNLMATVYGIGVVGDVLPVKRRKMANNGSAP